jgi:hypothetical protein
MMRALPRRPWSGSAPGVFVARGIERTKTPSSLLIPSLFNQSVRNPPLITPPHRGPPFTHPSLQPYTRHHNTHTQVSGGFNVGQVAGAFSCQTPVANAFDYEGCPYELRVYGDAIPGTTVFFCVCVCVGVSLSLCRCRCRCLCLSWCRGLCLCLCLCLCLSRCLSLFRCLCLCMRLGVVCGT